jgi:gliding motility-associated protein GldC
MSHSILCTSKAFRQQVSELQALTLSAMQSTITIDVTLDETRMPENISWSATESTMNKGQKAKAMILGFWDGEEKTALRIDLWTRQMMVDEMADFFFQTMMSMADTYERATKQTDLVKEMKRFAQEFYSKFQDSQIKENKV